MARSVKPGPGSLSLFETNEPQSSTPQTGSSSSETAEAAPTETRVVDACPRCGGRSLKTVRSFDHDGKTHYCAGGCLSEDRMDAFYFSPKVEGFDKQAEKEEAKKIIVSEAPGPRLLKESPHKPYFEENGFTIYHGDCREILLWLPTRSIDLAITDPPYGVAYDGNPSTPREELEGDHSAELYKPMLKFLNTRCKPSCALYLFYADGDAAVLAAVLAAGFEVRNTLIWNKNNAQGGALSAQYKQKHEPFLYCHLKGEAPQWFGPTNEVSVWNCDRSMKNGFHPTQKPVGLLKRAIKNSSKEGDLVLDPFAGSGSTLVAAKDLGRRGIGIEIEEHYCEIAANRLRQSVMEF